MTRRRMSLLPIAPFQNDVCIVNFFSLEEIKTVGKIIYAAIKIAQLMAETEENGGK